MLGAVTRSACLSVPADTRVTTVSAGHVFYVLKHVVIALSSTTGCMGLSSQLNMLGLCVWVLTTCVDAGSSS